MKKAFLILGLVAVSAVAGGATAWAVAKNSGGRSVEYVEREVERTPALGTHFTSYQSEKYPDLTYAAENAVKAVVNIEAIQQIEMRRNRSYDPFLEFFGIPQQYGYGDDRPQYREQRAGGSGVIISADGYIVTNNHVVDGASKLRVKLNDGRTFDAKLVGTDSATDVALLKIDAEGLTPAVVGDSNALVIGEEVMAVGNPLGTLSGTVTNGIVSALNRNIAVQNNDGSVNRLSVIQTNASISPGNSGGGLFNMAGELVGIVNAKSGASQAEGIGFAIPISNAIAIAQDLLENGYVSGRPYLGITYITVADEATAQQLGVSAYGIYIVEVSAGSGAAQAGLEPGDRIVSIDGQEIAARDDVSAIIDGHATGDVISITVARDGQMLTVSATLGEQTPNN